MHGAPSSFTRELADATPLHPAPILERFPPPQSRASSQPREPPPLGRPVTVLLGPRCLLLSPGLPLPGLLLGDDFLLVQVSSGIPGLRDTCLFPGFAGRFPRCPAHLFRGAENSSPGPAACASPCPSLVLRFLGVGSRSLPGSMFYLFLFDIQPPLGVCGGMFLLVKCKELL